MRLRTQTPVYNKPLQTPKPLGALNNRLGSQRGQKGADGFRSRRQHEAHGPFRTGPGSGVLCPCSRVIQAGHSRVRFRGSPVTGSSLPPVRHFPVGSQDLSQAIWRAIRVARAYTVICGLTMMEVGSTLASATYKPGTSWVWPLAATTLCAGSAPIRQVPCGW